MRSIPIVLAGLLSVGCVHQRPSLKGVVLPPPPKNRYQELLEQNPDPDLGSTVEAIAQDRLEAQEKEAILRKMLKALGAEDPKK